MRTDNPCMRSGRVLGERNITVFQIYYPTPNSVYPRMNVEKKGCLACTGRKVMASSNTTEITAFTTGSELRLKTRHAKNPTSSSSTYRIFLCIDCFGVHRNSCVISFVKRGIRYMRLALGSAVYEFQYYLQILDLIQDLRGETSPSRIKVSTDGEHVIATGIYPPQVNVELRAVKFERHLIYEIINFQPEI